MIQTIRRYFHLRNDKEIIIDIIIQGMNITSKTLLLMFKILFLKNKEVDNMTATFINRNIILNFGILYFINAIVPII
ncbi:MAG: hypothetical protein K0R54_239 [Clostridiaceae bacterium]|jgi:hypothetical protein|nr:hypothetical protein [Clostridiaceae bacterium]